MIWKQKQQTAASVWEHVSETLHVERRCCSWVVYQFHFTFHALRSARTSFMKDVLRHRYHSSGCRYTPVQYGTIRRRASGEIKFYVSIISGSVSVTTEPSVLQVSESLSLATATQATVLFVVYRGNRSIPLIFAKTHGRSATSGPSQEVLLAWNAPKWSDRYSWCRF